MEQTQSKKRLGALPLALCGLFTALVAIGAFLQIPVPYFDYFTLQFFFVVLAGMLLGRSYGALSVGGYVLLGLAGVPIFAAGGGIGYVISNCFSRYAYGQAIVAIGVVLLFTYAMELAFTRIKEKKAVR